MEPADAPQGEVAAGMAVADVMAHVAESEAPLGVSRDGRIVGQISKEGLLRRLLDPRAGD